MDYKKMYIIQNRWEQIRQEFLTLILLIALHVGVGYYSNWYATFGTVWSVSGGFLGMFLLCSLVLFPDKLLPSSSVKYMQRKSPESRRRMNAFHHKFLLFFFLIISLFKWYPDYSKFLDIEYLLFCAQGIITYMLLNNVLERYYDKAHKAYKQVRQAKEAAMQVK